MRHCSRRNDPAPLAPASLRPIDRDLGHIHQENDDVMQHAVFFVQVTATGFGAQTADQAGLFPRFLERRLAGRLARLDVPLWSDPALAAARANQAYASIAYRNHRRLADGIDEGCHRGPPYLEERERFST